MGKVKNATPAAEWWILGAHSNAASALQLLPQQCDSRHVLAQTPGERVSVFARRVLRRIRIAVNRGSHVQHLCCVLPSNAAPKQSEDSGPRTSSRSPLLRAVSGLVRHLEPGSSFTLVGGAMPATECMALVESFRLVAPSGVTVRLIA